MGGDGELGLEDEGSRVAASVAVPVDEPGALYRVPGHHESLHGQWPRIHARGPILPGGTRGLHGEVG